MYVMVPYLMSLVIILRLRLMQYAAIFEFVMRGLVMSVEMSIYDGCCHTLDELGLG